MLSLVVRKFHKFNQNNFPPKESEWKVSVSVGYLCVRHIWMVNPAAKLRPVMGEGKKNPEADCVTASLRERVEAMSYLPKL